MQGDAPVPGDGGVDRPIYYLCTRKHAYTIGILLGLYPTSLSRRVMVLPYEDIGAIGRLPRGAFIFTDFDRLSPEMTARAALLHRFLREEAGTPMPCLNHPRGSATRFALLRTLREAGINDFNAYRLDEADRVERFPVFLRHERGHQAPLTPLLTSPEELRLQIGRVLARERDHSDIIVVEFCNKPGADGRYRKYGAYRVGETIYAQHCFTREDWFVKGPRYDAPDSDRAAHESYVRDNPHRDQLRQIYSLAGIDYGRVDYAVVDGRIQVYEINTNPTVLDDAPRRRGDFDSGFYARLHEEALLGIPLPLPGPALDLPAELRDAGRSAIDPARNHRALMQKVVSSVRRRQIRANLKRIVRLALGRATNGP